MQRRVLCIDRRPHMPAEQNGVFDHGVGARGRNQPRHAIQIGFLQPQTGIDGDFTGRFGRQNLAGAVALSIRIAARIHHARLAFEHAANVEPAVGGLYFRQRDARGADHAVLGEEPLAGPAVVVVIDTDDDRRIGRQRHQVADVAAVVAVERNQRIKADALQERLLALHRRANYVQPFGGELLTARVK